MSPAPGWRRLLRLSLGRRSIERDVDTEMGFHIQMRIEDLMRQGKTPDDAEAQALREYGDTGAAVGLMAFRRLPGHPVSWVVSGAAVGAASGAAMTGAAMIASGRRLGRIAATAGMRIDADRSVPTSNGVIPEASAAAAPPLDPPGVRSTSHGLLVRPKMGLLV